MAGWGWRIYEFAENSRSVIGAWLVAKGVSTRDRAQLQFKIDALALYGPDLPAGLLAGPIASKRNRKMQSHIYKLRVNGEKALRPLLCKGPLDMQGEFTLLLGAIEVNRKLDVDVEEAEERRSIVIRDPSRRLRNGRYK